MISHFFTAPFAADGGYSRGNICSRPRHFKLATAYGFAV